MTPTPIGVAGCGRMGLPMLMALRACGFDVRGFDIRDPASYGENCELIVNDPAVFAVDLQCLITVVRDQAQTEDLLFSNQGLIAKAPNLKVLVISSTLSPLYVKGLADRLPATLNLVDAPMSGAQIAAENRNLSFMLGGKPEILARLKPIFLAMGTSLHPVGGFGAGMSAKVLNNLLAASSTAMTRLVLDWADAEGIEKEKLLDLINASSGQNWFASGFQDIEFAQHGYETDNTMGILKKDVEAALDACPDGADTALPSAVITYLQSLKPRKI